MSIEWQYIIGKKVDWREQRYSSNNCETKWLRKNLLRLLLLLSVCSSISHIHNNDVTDAYTHTECVRSQRLLMVPRICIRRSSFSQYNKLLPRNVTQASHWYCVLRIGIEQIQFDKFKSSIAISSVPFFSMFITCSSQRLSSFSCIFACLLTSLANDFGTPEHPLAAIEIPFILSFMAVCHLSNCNSICILRNAHFNLPFSAKQQKHRKSNLLNGNGLNFEFSLAEIVAFDSKLMVEALNVYQKSTRNKSIWCASSWVFFSSSLAYDCHRLHWIKAIFIKPIAVCACVSKHAHYGLNAMNIKLDSKAI